VTTVEDAANLARRIGTSTQAAAINDRSSLTAAIIEKISGAHCVIVVPPFSNVTLPALGPHLLQAIAEAEGMCVRILYSNLIFAALIGLGTYQAICEDRHDAVTDGHSQGPQLLGERIFARLAHGLPSLGSASSRCLSVDTPLSTLAEVEACTDYFCDVVAESLVSSGCQIIGFTSSFQQINASFAMLRAAKVKGTHIVTLLGGANCEASMGTAVLRQGGPDIDFVFSGESDYTFPRILKSILDGHRPEKRLINGEPNLTLDKNPPPRFAEYFLQLKEFVPEFDLKHAWLTYETSRGCWWGHKHHCTFCGLNGETMTFREKSAGKVLADLKVLITDSPTSMIAMADNIMPHRYHATLVPDLREARLPVSIFYEQKANLTLNQIKKLRDAGVTAIQPGIEALATPLLKLMKKGVTASQNIMLLRYARSVDMSVSWNLLCEIPGDQAVDYKKTLDILPLLRHLHPPTGVSRISIDRFSPYYESSVDYGINNVRPWVAYFDVFPPGSDVSSIAYHFMGDYISGSRNSPVLISAIEDEARNWRSCWEQKECPRPSLTVIQIEEEVYCLIDTRAQDRPRFSFLDACRARAALTIVPLEDEYAKWAICEGFAIEIDGRSIPLATASYDLLIRFQDGRVRPQPRDRAFVSV
jgi:ribosomal peptide maturation radical SAM protein 1